MSKTQFLGSIETEIEERLRVLRTNDIHNEIKLWQDSVERIRDKDILDYANNFLLELSFEHEGLTKDQYCAHCYRVSTMALHFSENDQQTMGAIGLLHNVLEVSDIPKKTIQKEFGTEISSALSTLKVERQLQRDQEYLEEYYQRIKDHSSYLFKVKVVDKLDNLFVLGLNPNEEVRKVYLEEIENFVVPMASEIETELAAYFENLIDYNNKVGHFTKENFRYEEE